MIRLLLLGMLGLTLGTTSVWGKSAKVYGEKPSLSKPMLLQEAMSKNPGAKPVLVKGVVKQICEKKGCWLVLEDGAHSVRVTFEGYSFFVPMSLQKKQVKVQGVLSKKEISQAMQRHYLEDGGASPEEIAAVKGPKVTWTFVATGLEAI